VRGPHRLGDCGDRAEHSKEVSVQDFLGPDDARKAVKHAMALYDKLFSYMHRTGPRG